MENRREAFLKKTRESMREALQSRDRIIAHVQRSIDELMRVKNFINERLEEWYIVYFPELHIEDKNQYAHFVLGFDKKAPDEKFVASILGEKRAQLIVDRAKRSLGAELNEEDVAMCKSLAQRIIDLDNQIIVYEKYQERLCEEFCPNMARVAGAPVAAKLISHVGSLLKLAVLPASTIQVLGAEKALFKHLKNKRIDPPKHGIIFQHVHISSSPKAVRGKIARALANKLALASKADAFTHSSIGDKLKKDFERRYQAIMEQHQKKKDKMKERET